MLSEEAHMVGAAGRYGGIVSGERHLTKDVFEDRIARAASRSMFGVS